MVIGGVEAKADSTFDVVNPSTGEVMAVVGEICENGVQKTLEAAEKGFAVWSKMTPAQRKELLASPRLRADARHEIKLEATYGEKLGDKGIKGFDLARSMCLARWGYTAGLLSEEEAWQAIMLAAQDSQRIFDSWEEFGTSYLVGRRFWSPTDSGHDEAKKMYETLLAPDGSWTHCKWEIDLTPKP